MIGVLLAVTLGASPLERHDHRTWSIDDGLPQSSVTAIAQDRDGWLHLGTFGGLARFDGREFAIHGAPIGLGWSTVRITALMVASDGTRWLGLQSGEVVRVDGAGADVPLPDDHGLLGKPIWAFAEVDGSVWVAGSAGVTWFDGGWHPIAGAGPNRALASHHGEVWLGGPFGLQRVDDGVAVAHPDPVGELYALLPEGDALLMVGELGVTRLRDGAVEVIDPEAGHDLAMGADGTIYVASGSRLRILGERGGLRLGSRVRDVFIGREQGIWVGTDAHGLHRLMPEDWSLVDVGAGTLPLLEADDGSLLAGYGCEVGGLVRVGTDGGLAGIAGGCVRALARYRDEIVAGVDGVVARMGDGGLEPIVDLEHDVLVLLGVGDELYAGTDDGGAFRIRDGEATPLPIADRRVLAIAVGAAGELWFGAQDALVRMVGDRVTRWTRSDGIPAAEIRALRVDADGTVFMGSYGGGLGVLRGGGFARLTRDDGLAEDVVSAILDDGRGALWLHGNRGLTRLMRGDLEAWLVDPSDPVTVRRWATPEGNGGGQPAGVVMRDGSLALPTIDGIVRIDPSTFRHNGTTPTLTVLRAELDGTKLVPNLEIEAPAGSGRVEIEVTAALLRHPELATFEYRVRELGEDDAAQQWRPLGDDRRLQWAGFPPGRHAIDLRVASESGLYSPVVTLPFALAAAWHERWDVRIAIALGGILLVGAALTWRARAERRHLRGLQREIDQRLAAEAETRALAQRLDQAERLEAVGRLAGGVAHDFNNLFAAIRGATSLLTGESSDVERANPIRTLEACVDRGARLTGQLLSFAGKQHLDAHTFDPHRRIASIEALLAAPLPADVGLRIVAADEPMFVLADASALELAVVSLVLNARDALPVGGSITVRTIALDDAAARSQWPDLPGEPAAPSTGLGWVVVEVADDGIGIPDDRLAKVLEPFYSTRSDATGLGLPSVLGFATQSGGALRLSSHEGEGTRASIVLPRVAAPTVTPVVAPSVVTRAPRVGSPRIVVVDDDDLVRTAIAMMLRRAGHDAQVFADPTQALAALAGGLACDLLVTDVLMPVLTGSELAARVLAIRPGLPVLFISGFIRDVDAGSLPGPLLAKPFGADEVLAAVDAALGEPRRAANTAPG